jgi:hypothetical protein
MKMKNLYAKLLLLIMAMLVIGNGYSQNCPSGLVSYWKLDDESDVLFEDSYGNHDAESDNSVTNEPSGKVLAAKYFDGTNVVSVPNHADFNFPANSSFSIELWVKYSEIIGDRSNILIGKNDPYAAGAYWAIGIDNPSGQLYFDLRDATGQIYSVQTTSALSTGAWHHVVAVRSEASNQNILYLDGISVGTPVTFDYTGNFASTGDLYISSLLRNGIPDYFFKGTLDEIAIYNKALTQVEVSEHMSKNNFGLGICDSYSPNIISTPPTTAVVGLEYAYTVKAIGMPTMSYSLVTAPTGMTINSSSGVISWIPTSINQDGLVRVRANNNVTPADTQTFRIFLANAPVCPANLLALWKLNETSGPTYVDFYNDHTIQATVAPTATTGKIKGAQQFSASTIMDIPDRGSEFEWGYSSNFSFEFWLKTASTATMVVLGRYRDDDAIYPNAANWFVGTSGGQATFFLRDNTGVTPELPDGNYFEITGGPSLADNQWHHVIAVREGSIQENRLYVDGLKVANVTTNYNHSFISDDSTEINMGWFDNTATGYHFVGALDEVAIFNKAISDAEASQFYNSGQPTGHCAITNYAPAITSIPVTTATEDVVYTYTFTVEDIDASDIIILSAETKPDWLSFNYTPGQKSAVLTGTPTNDNVGDNDVVLRVNDGHMTKDQSFTINVVNVNDPPEITSTPVTGAYVGNLYNYEFTAIDVDNAVITLSAVLKPDWLTFTPETGLLTGTPAQEDKGDHDVILRASDGTAHVDQEFTITVDGPDALSDLEAAGIRIYPVPAKTYLSIEFGSLTQETHLELINAAGSIVKKAVIQAGQNLYNLDLHGVEPGSYYLHIKNATLNNIGRFVITE